MAPHLAAILFFMKFHQMYSWTFMICSWALNELSWFFNVQNWRRNYVPINYLSSAHDLLINGSWNFYDLIMNTIMNGSWTWSWIWSSYINEIFMNLFMINHYIFININGTPFCGHICSLKFTIHEQFMKSSWMMMDFSKL